MKLVPKSLSTAILLVGLTSNTAFALSSIPDDGRQTGQWPTAAPDTFDGVTPMAKNLTLLVERVPKVTMVGDWKAQIDFTTAIPTTAAVIYYGQYDEVDALLPLPRFSKVVRETLEGKSTDHSVILDFSGLKKEKADINGLAAKNGGVIAYRIELHSLGERDYDDSGRAYLRPTIRVLR